RPVARSGPLLEAPRPRPRLVDMARRDQDDARPLADLRQLRPRRDAANVVPRGLVIDDLNARVDRAVDRAVRRDQRRGAVGDAERERLASGLAVVEVDDGPAVRLAPEGLASARR